MPTTPATRKKMREYDKAERTSAKLSIHEILGLSCVWCGFDDPRALQIDHVNGDGAADRAGKSSLAYWKGILKKLMDGSKEYQLLCANCNQIKKVENNEQPHANTTYE